MSFLGKILSEGQYFRNQLLKLTVVCRAFRLYTLPMSICFPVGKTNWLPQIPFAIKLHTHCKLPVCLPLNTACKFEEIRVHSNFSKPKTTRLTLKTSRHSWTDPTPTTGNLVSTGEKMETPDTGRFSTQRTSNGTLKALKCTSMHWKNGSIPVALDLSHNLSNKGCWETWCTREMDNVAPKGQHCLSRRLSP